MVIRLQMNVQSKVGTKREKIPEQMGKVVDGGQEEGQQQCQPLVRSAGNHIAQRKDRVIQRLASSSHRSQPVSKKVAERDCRHQQGESEGMACLIRVTTELGSNTCSRQVHMEQCFPEL